MRATTCLLVFALFVAGCAGDGGTDPDETANGSRFSARIDGVPWVATETTARINGAPGGLFVISGYTTQGPVTGIGITLGNIGGVGTYPLGVGPTVFGGGASVAVDGAR